MNQGTGAEPGGPLMYGELASWWPVLSAPADYAEEAEAYSRIFLDHCAAPRTLLELGSGGGNNAWHMKQHFRQVTLVDLSEGMLEVSRALNPDCEHTVGDMRSVRLRRTFDCVFLHDAICYMTSATDLRLAMETAFVHVRPGGLMLTETGFVAEATHFDHSEVERPLPIFAALRPGSAPR